MEHAVGWVILGLNLVLLGGFVPWWLVRRWAREKPQVDYTFRGIGVRFMSGAEPIWPKLHEAIDLMLRYMPQHPDWTPGSTARLTRRLYIEIYPHDAILTHKPGMTGFVDPETGLRVPAPTNAKEAAQVAKIHGTWRCVRPGLIGPAHDILMLTQQRRDGEPWEHRLGLGRGPLRPAGHSGLFHEVVAHVFPYRQTKKKNLWHTRPELVELEHELTRAFDALHEDA